MAFRMTRTEGDGMENVTDVPLEIINPANVLMPASVHAKSASKSAVKPFDAKSIATAHLIKLKPVCVPRRKHSSSSLSYEKVKEPKFVPFEPYKAAVRPIISTKKYNGIKGKVLEDIRRRAISCSSDMTEGDSKVPQKESKEYIKLEEELQKLKLENEELEKQLQLQVQVNGELKNLLVAAVGEDIETKVNCLAEDKQHLAQKLINTAKNLSTHQEQVEWLASQCEVWRSKFLASSVMVEELARWKASLSQKILEGEQVMKRVLDERREARKSLLALHTNLVLLRGNFDLLSKRVPLKTSNVIDLSAECRNITDGLIVQLLGRVQPTAINNEIQQLPHSTEAEKAVDHMLKHPHLMGLIGEPDAACSAVVGAAVALHSQLYHQNNPPRIACCRQCTGQIKLV